MTIVRATFAGKDKADRAAVALRRYGAAASDITVSDPPRQEEDETAHSAVRGAVAGAAAGTLAGAAVTAATAMALPVALPAVAALSLGGAAMGGMGGSVAGVILGSGEGAKHEQEAPAGEPHLDQGWTVVSVVATEEQVPAIEAALARLGGHLTHEAA